jgi:hypothetical protein
MHGISLLIGRTEGRLPFALFAANWCRSVLRQRNYLKLREIIIIIIIITIIIIIIIIIIITTIILLAFTTHLRVLASFFLRFQDHTQWHTTVGRTPLDEWSARRRDLYLTDTQQSQQTNIHAPGGIRTRNPSRRAAADPRLRPLGHWDQILIIMTY